MKNISTELLGNFVSGSNQAAMEARSLRLMHVLFEFLLPLSAFLGL
jgi:hypothetical protein